MITKYMKCREEVKRYKEALEAIRSHQGSLMAGNCKHLSTTWRIADNALKHEAGND